MAGLPPPCSPGLPEVEAVLFAGAARLFFIGQPQLRQLLRPVTERDSLPPTKKLQMIPQVLPQLASSSYKK